MQTLTFNSIRNLIFMLCIACTFPHAWAEEAPTVNFQQAVRQGDLLAVQYYLQKDTAATVNAKWHNDWMPLHHAVSENQIAVAQLLLENGGPINVQPAGDFYGTPLHIAAFDGNEPMVKLLLAAGADVNIKNGYGERALDKAEEHGYGKVIQILLAAGSTVSEGYNNKITPLHNAVSENNSAEVRRLLAAGANANARSGIGLTPLLLATQQGNHEIAAILINHGADVEALDDKKETPLFTAALGGNVALIKLLLENGANVNAQGQFGAPPLHQTTFGDHADAARMLIQHGAKVEGALHGAATHSAVATAKVLLENGADVNAIDILVPISLSPELKLELTELDAELIAELEQLDAEVAAELEQLDAEGKETADAAMDAAFSSMSSSMGDTPLHNAAFFGNAAITQLLIENGADINAVSFILGTPLDAANKSNNIETANVLKRHDAEEESFFNSIWKYVELVMASYDLVIGIQQATETKQAE